MKLALCVALAALQANYRAIYTPEGTPAPGAEPALLPIEDSFYNLDNTQLHLVGRTEGGKCEDDTLLRQTIPYIVLRDSEGRYFAYGRGGKGEEGRLIGAVSLGLGGHMDDQIPDGMSFKNWLLVEGNRELDEEAKLGPAPLVFSHLIADTDPVGCVHCGVLAIRQVSDDEKADIVEEKGCIDNGQWLTLEELRTPEWATRLEGWSSLVVRNLDSSLSA